VAEPALVVGPDLMRLFAEASGDHNPLHTSAEYARATSVGRPVVFGMLAALVVISRMPAAGRIRLIRTQFHEVMHPGDLHKLTMTPEGTGHRGELWACGRRVLTVSVQREPVPTTEWPIPPATPPPMRRHPRELSLDEIEPGMEVSGRYSPARLDELIARLALTRTDLSCAAIAALCWTSYVVGMELPGRQALLSAVTVTPHEHAAVPEYRYQAKITRVDSRFGLLRNQGWLWTHDQPAAEVTLESFLRPAERVVTLSDVRAALPAMEALTGRVAVVIGASRGLGAATALAMAEQGCTVIGVYRTSTTRAAELARHDLIDMVRGDATDNDFCRALVERVRARHGRADVLVCSAGPVLRPVRLSEETTEMLIGHVTDALRLVAVPVNAFAPLLDANASSVLVMSSQVLDRPGPDWPHYAAAKAAVEQLVRAISPAHPRWRILLARLPALDTDLSTLLRTPRQRPSPAVAAASLLTALSAPHTPGCRLLKFTGSAELE
jgi:acyl dehydratase